jgi:phosphatidylglycerol---prolipoprotein diacylglyceryl transferase
MQLTNHISWNIDPIIFEIGFLSLRWYSLFFVSGFFISYQILKRHFQREEISQAVLDKLTVYMVCGTVIGARLGHCLFYDFEYYSDNLLEVFLPVTFHPSFSFTGFQGLASHGAAIGILISVLLFSKRYGTSLLWILDKLALVIPLAGCLIRIGNFMNSEMIGHPTSVPWAIVFEKVDPLPRHPGQLYEAILYLLIFLFLTVLDKRVHKRPGFIFGLFLATLFFSRLMVEFWKEDQSGFENDMLLNMGQLLSLPFILLGVWLLLSRSRNSSSLEMVDPFQDWSQNKRR